MPPWQAEKLAKVVKFFKIHAEFGKFYNFAPLPPDVHVQLRAWAKIRVSEISLNNKV